MKDDVKKGNVPMFLRGARRMLGEFRFRKLDLELKNEQLRRANEAVEASRAEYFGLFDRAPVGYFTQNDQGLILQANLTAVTMLGLTKDEPVGKPLSQYILPDDQDTYYRHQRQVSDLGVLQSCELRMLRAGGVPFWARLEAVTVPAETTGAALCRTTISDITERKQVEERLVADAHRYALALSAVSDGLWDWHIPTGHAFFSEQYYAMLGYENEEFPASYAAWRERVHPDDITRAEEALRRYVEQGRGFEIHFRMMMKSGESRWLAARGKVVDRNSSGASVRMVGTLTDINARKQIEMALCESQRALRQSNEVLERKIQERTAFLTDAVGALKLEIRNRKETARELSLANEQLCALTIQLRALAGELTMAEHRERKRLSRVLHDHLQPMLASAKLRVSCLAGMDQDVNPQLVSQIVELLNDSLAISRSLAGELCPPILHEGGLQAGLRWLAHWMYDNYGIQVDLVMREETLSFAEDVRILLFESVRELLFNAVKHANAPSVRVDLQSMGDASLRIIVSDEGVGFDPGQAQSLAHSGVGFGLFSIRERINLIGGSLEIDSAPGKGSRFTLSVPAGHKQAASNRS